MGDLSGTNTCKCSNTPKGCDKKLLEALEAFIGQKFDEKIDVYVEGLSNYLNDMEKRMTENIKNYLSGDFTPCEDKPVFSWDEIAERVDFCGKSMLKIKTDDGRKVTLSVDHMLQRAYCDEVYFEKNPKSRTIEMKFNLTCGDFDQEKSRFLDEFFMLLDGEEPFDLYLNNGSKSLKFTGVKTMETMVESGVKNGEKYYRKDCCVFNNVTKID